MFSENERKTARILVENEAYIDLIAKIFTPDKDTWIDKFPIDTPDAEYGQNMKALRLAEAKIADRLSLLRKLAYRNGDAPVTKGVPK